MIQTIALIKSDIINICFLLNLSAITPLNILHTTTEIKPAAVTIPNNLALPVFQPATTLT